MNPVYIKAANIYGGDAGILGCIHIIIIACSNSSPKIKVVLLQNPKPFANREATHVASCYIWGCIMCFI